MSDDRMAQARAEAWRRYPEGWDPYNDKPVDDWGYSECQREAFLAGVEWADANPQPLPRPGDGCQCTGYSQDAGGGHFEYLVEYEPACPEHSEHVYNPRTGVWADAHPQPHTITLSQSEAILEAGRAGRYEDHEAALRAAGIEVEDDDE